MRMGAVHLTVGDLARSLDYYENAIGLRVHGRDNGTARLGTGGEDLLVLTEQPGAQPADGYSGLFHFALLVPTRTDLGRWLKHAAREGVPLTGMSDHAVSEALYLRDPDHHGIEIYADRARETWEGKVGELMTTMPLDTVDLVRGIDDEPFDGLAEGTTMGHVHFCVADVPATVEFYRGLGFDVMAQRGDEAAFLATAATTTTSARTHGRAVARRTRPTTAHGSSAPRSSEPPRSGRSSIRPGSRSHSRPIASRLGFRAMEAEDLGLDTNRDLQGVYRYYELAKRAEWQVRDLPWGEIPPIPEYSGSPQKLARRRDLWRSVITQQLQADELAVEMATQLFAIAPDHEAKLYYTTMVQDESRHTEAWLKLIAESGGMAERDPHLDQLAHMTLDADSLEEKVFLMQVFYERLIIPRFRMIARSSRGTILEDLCNRLTIDDGIHHGAGMAYERVLLEGAGRGVQTKLVEAANRMLPLFTQHALWRPKAREFIGALMRETDIRMLKEDLEQGVKLAMSLGIDVSNIELPSELH